jgi:hypothetical protein
MEVSVHDSQTWFGVALGIPQNTEYLWKTLPEGPSTSWNVLEFTYHLVGDPMWLLSFLSGSPLFAK